MKQSERNARRFINTGKIRVNCDGVRAETQAIKEKYGFTHAEIYEAGLKYLVEFKEKSQQDENISLID